MLVLVGGRVGGRWNEQPRQRTVGLVPATQCAGLGEALRQNCCGLSLLPQRVPLLPPPLCQMGQGQPFPRAKLKMTVSYFCQVFCSAKERVGQARLWQYWFSRYKLPSHPQEAWLAAEAVSPPPGQGSQEPPVPSAAAGRRHESWHRSRMIFDKSKRQKAKETYN